MPKNSDTLERLFKEMVLKEKPEFRESEKIETVSSNIIDRFFELYRKGLIEQRNLHYVYPRGCSKTPFTSTLLNNGKIGYGYIINQLLFDEYAFYNPMIYKDNPKIYKIDEFLDDVKVFTKYPSVISGFKVYLSILNPKEDNSNYTTYNVKMLHNKVNKNGRIYNLQKK